jgi:hypothetical protein
VIVYVVVCVGETVREPLTPMEPMLGLMDTDVALFDVHWSVADCPD